ncbi:hypothetical protein V5799_009223 [Amblyomma americanum]|uniref:Uncharacterized protein n=1 Tax=Amblyomma americanum TaxID=6943 RepID=A0AAQ4FAZ8_AMBAM
METLHLVVHESSKKDHDRPLQRAARTTSASIDEKAEAYLRYLHLLSAAAEAATQGVWPQIYLLQVFARLMETLHLVDQESSKKDHDRPLQRAARTTASIGEKVEAYLCYLHLLSAAAEATTQGVWPQSYLLQVFARLMETLHLVDLKSSKKDHDRPLQRAARTTASIGEKVEAYLCYLHLLSATAEATTQGVWPQSYLLQVFARLMETLHLVDQESSIKTTNGPSRERRAQRQPASEKRTRPTCIISLAQRSGRSNDASGVATILPSAGRRQANGDSTPSGSRKPQERPRSAPIDSGAHNLSQHRKKDEAYLRYLHLLSAAAEATTQGVWPQSYLLQVFARLMETLHLVDQESSKKNHDRPVQRAARTTTASIGEKDEAYLRYLHLLSAAAEATTQGVWPQSYLLQVFARLMETLHLVDQETIKKDHDRPLLRAARSTTASIGEKVEAYLCYLHLLSAAAEATTQGV